MGVGFVIVVVDGIYGSEGIDGYGIGFIGGYGNGLIGGYGILVLTLLL